MEIEASTLRLFCAEAQASIGEPKEPCNNCAHCFAANSIEKLEAIVLKEPYSTIALASKRIEELEAEKKALEDYKALTCKLIPDAEKEARCIFAQNSMEYSREKPSNMEGAIKQVAEHFAMRDARIEWLREALERVKGQGRDFQMLGSKRDGQQQDAPDPEPVPDVDKKPPAAR